MAKKAAVAIVPTKKTKTVSSSPVKTTAQGALPNQEGSPLEDLAGRLVDKSVELAELVKKTETLKTQMEGIENVLVERMAESQIQRLSVKGKTVYLAKKVIVNRGKGIVADDFFKILKGLGFGELVSDSVNASSLKALVVEMMSQAAESGNMGLRCKCQACGEFTSEVKTESEANAVAKKHICGKCNQDKLVAVSDGIPLQLRAALYVDQKFEIGMRSAG